MAEITHIFYDLDGTLRLSVPAGRLVFADGATSLGVTLDAEARQRAAIWEHRYWAASPELRADSHDFPDEESFWTRYSQRQLLVLGASPEQAADLAHAMHQYMAAYYNPEDVIPPDVAPTLQALRERGYQMGIMSNRENPYQQYLAQVGLDGFFGQILCAPESGFRKPNPGAFYYMLQKAEARAENSLYIGDNYFADVVGAREAGIKPILFDINGLFKDSDCLVIARHSQIFDLLG